MKDYQHTGSLTVCTFGDSKCPQQRRNEQVSSVYEHLVINYCHSGTLQTVPSFFNLYNLLPVKVVLNVPKPQTEINTAFNRTGKRKLDSYFSL